MSTTRFGLHELSEHGCWERLRGASPPVGRLGFVAQQHPLVLPINYVVDGETVVVRFAEDTVLDEAVDARVAFEVDEVEQAWEEGWSVVVRGRAGEVTDHEELARMRRLRLRPWAGTDRVRFLRIDATVGITGRVIR